VLVWRWIRNAPPIPLFAKYGNFAGNVDRWHYYDYGAREEPGALAALAGICAGGGEQSLSRLRPGGGGEHEAAGVSLNTRLGSAARHGTPTTIIGQATIVDLSMRRAY